MSIKINPDESTELKFQVNVVGSSDIPNPRLIIPISENGISLIFEGKLDDHEVTVDISELLSLTDSVNFDGKLEVIVGENIFVPWEDEITIEQPMKVVATSLMTEPIKEETKVEATVEVSKPKKKKPVKEEKKPKKVMKVKKKTKLSEKFLS
jgi:hypothetical protein